MQRFIFPAVTHFAVTIQIEAMVSKLNAVAGRDFALARFDRLIAELNHFTAVQADKMIVMLLLR